MPAMARSVRGPISVCRVINNRASTAIAGRTMGPRQFDDGLVLASPLDSPLSLGPEAAAVPRWGRFKRQDFEGHEDGGSRVYAIIAPAMRSSRCGSAQNVLGSIVTSRGARI